MFETSLIAALALPWQTAPEVEDALPAADWSAVGLVLTIVGSFFLANAILFRHPRGLVREHFGARDGRLRSIREYIFHRVQIHLGFLFLLAGFGCQLFGHLRPPAEPVSGFPVLWVGVILAAAVVLEVAGWWLSRRQFQTYVREYLLEKPNLLDADAEVARELGALFGIDSAGDDTVQAYVARVRKHLRLPWPDRGPAPLRRLHPADDSVEEELA